MMTGIVIGLLLGAAYFAITTIPVNRRIRRYKRELRNQQEYNRRQQEQYENDPAYRLRDGWLRDRRGR